MGNLFSVKLACERMGLDAAITSDPEAVHQADAVVVPGIGAFEDAMRVLRERGLDAAIRDVAQSGTPLLGICLGMQLFMDESREFGRHAGLGLIPGSVVRFELPATDGRPAKIPQVCWNTVNRTPHVTDDVWDASLLGGLPGGLFMYFVHSYHVVLADPGMAVGTTRYGGIEFCSALRLRNVIAFQGHPERSGPQGLEIYANLARAVRARRHEENVCRPRS